MTIGQKIKFLRKQNGWLQEDLAKSIDMNVRQISRYENDRVVPSINIIIKFAKVFNVTTDYLIFDDYPYKIDEKANNQDLVEEIVKFDEFTLREKRMIKEILKAIEIKRKFELKN